MVRRRKGPAPAAPVTALCVALCVYSAEGAKPPPPPPPPEVNLPGSTLPNLYQRTGKSEVAILGLVDGPGHYARFRVDEVYAGGYRGPSLEVIYRGESWGRRVDGLSPIKFEDGERYLLFLRYYREKGRVVRPDLFELMDGEWGKLKLSGEDEPLYVEAMRLLMGASMRPEIHQRHAVLIGLLDSPNHLAAGAAMYQVAEAGLGSVETIPTLLGQMESGHAALKVGALRILRRLGPTLPRSLSRESVAEAITLRVGWKGGDPVEVREQAVSALAALGPAAIPALERAARDDTNQMIRYQASVALVELAPGSGGGR